MKKYEFTGETMEKFGVTFLRIIALREIKQGDYVIAQKGETGGWIAEEKNLSQDGDAWVSGNARVYDNAQVSGDAWVSGDARVSGNARVSGDAWVYGDAWVSGNARVINPTDILTVGPIGSRDATTTFFRDKSGGICVACGCFLGTLAEFAEKVTATHGDSKHAKAYRAAVELAKIQIEEGQK